MARWRACSASFAFLRYSLGNFRAASSVARAPFSAASCTFRAAWLANVSYLSDRSGTLKRAAERDRWSVSFRAFRASLSAFSSAARAASRPASSAFLEVSSSRSAACMDNFWSWESASSISLRACFATSNFLSATARAASFCRETKCSESSCWLTPNWDSARCSASLSLSRRDSLASLSTECWRSQICCRASFADCTAPM
mmetsp:Transcript_107253/g.256071  ORF Transcript_107253/g.256071 Transcript_107253/m.256071 type:complete len:200 (-) Transcript_107253:154-753(-)